MASKADDEEFETAVGRVVSLRAPAMACEFTIQFPDDQTDRNYAMEAFDWIERFEQQLSVYRDTSELSEINRKAAEWPVRVEPTLFRLLLRCRDWQRESDGAFDITAGPLIKAWGFYQRQGRVPSDAELAAARARVGMEFVQFDESARTIQFQKAGMEINLGAVGKGYAIDSVASRLRRVGYRAILLGAGASSILAVGRPPWDDAWTVELRHPVDATRSVALVRLMDAAVSTSGLAEQHFKEGGRRYGHVIDPRNGRPVSEMLQTTALANDAVEAEALSTGFFVNGAEWAAALCERRPEIGALLIPAPKQNQAPRMIVLGRMREIVELPAADA